MRVRFAKRKAVPPPEDKILLEPFRGVLSIYYRSDRELGYSEYL